PSLSMIRSMPMRNWRNNSSCRFRHSSSRFCAAVDFFWCHVSPGWLWAAGWDNISLQKCFHASVFEMACLLERRALVVIADGSVGAGFEEFGQNGGFAEIDSGGIHQRCEAVIVGGIDGNVSFDEGRNDRGTIRDGRPVQEVDSVVIHDFSIRAGS